MEISTHILLNYLLEASLCLAVFYLFYVLVLRRQPSFTYNRAYLLLSSGLALMLPLLEISFLGGTPLQLTSISPDFAAFMLPEIIIGGVGENVQTTQTISWQYIVVWAYGVGVALMLLRFLWQIFCIKRVIRKGHLKMNQNGYCRNGYWVVHTNGRLPISSYFNYLLWDNQTKMEEADKKRIIAHEEVHIREGHSYDVCYMSLIKSLLWFNPLAHLYFKELTDVHEYAADAKVIEETDPQDYAKILVNQLFQGVGFSVLNHFYKSQTLKRLKMMELTKNKINKYRVLWALPVFALMFFVFSCQEEEDGIAQAEATLENYENIQEEIRVLNHELQAITGKYPDYKLHFRVLPGEPRPTFNSAEDFSKIIEGVDNAGDKKAIGQLHYQINVLREKLPRQAMAGADEVFTVVEDQPTPPDGMKSFYEYVSTNLKYPIEARQKGIEGKVFVQFVVDKDGSLINVETVKGIGAGCDEEAVRVLQNATAWNPGMQRGRAVRVRMVLPITFSLSGGDEISPASAKPEEIKASNQEMLMKFTKSGDRISGKVTDKEGNPLPGVNILLKGTTTGTVSDLDGNFALTNSEGASEVVFSFVGFTTKQISIN